MKSINIGCLVDSSVGIVKFINTVTRNTINPYYYHALSGPMKYNFVKYDQTKENDYAIVLLVIDPSRPLTKQEEQNILNKLPQDAPRAVVTINQSDASIGIMKDIDPLFSITINTNSFDGVDLLLYEIAQHTMKDPNIIYDMPHILDKFEKYLALIDLNRVISFTPATNTQVCKEATASFKIPSSEASYKWEDFDNRNGYQFGKLQYHWVAFKGKIALPPSYDPKKHVIRAKFGIDRNYLESTNDDNNPVGPEGRIWLNGQPLGAVDSFHDSHVITEGGEMEVRIFTGRCWTNHHLSQFGVEITERNTEAIYYRLKFLDRVIDKLSDSNPDKIRLIRTVDAAVRSLDVRDSYENGMWDIRIHDPNSTAFYASAPQCLEVLRSIAYMRPSNSNDDHFSISMIGYSHLDTCWQWPYSISHFKSANTITSMLHLIENPPDEFKDPVQWQYLATASQHYKWLKEDDPDLFERVKKMANDKKRWIVDGVSWLEHECVVLNGESMIRQMLYGEKFFMENLNAEQTCLFLPDCFGFSAALPQVLQGFGIDAFITSKISWSEYNDFPYHTFVWKGNDGSEVLSHFICDPASWNPKVSMYTGTATVSELLGTYQSYKQKDICPHSALTTVGNGDGGGGLTEEMIWNLNLLNEFPQISQVPKVQFPTLKSLFEEIRQQKNLLPVWDGELYLEYHRGTQTTMEETKRQNRKLEHHLRNTEFIMSILKNCYDYFDKSDQQTLIECWEDACLYQFHDALPGTTINEASIDVIMRGQQTLKKVKQIENKLGQILAEKEKSNLTVSTTAPFYGISSQQSPNQDKYKTTMYKKTLDDSFEIVELSFDDEDPTVNEPFEYTVSTRTVTTTKMKVQFNKYGGICSVVVDGREFISDSVPPFFIYEDRPLQWPAWDIQLYHKEMQDKSPVLLTYALSDKNQLIYTWQVPEISENSTAEPSIIRQIISFQGTTIDMKTEVKWTQHDKLLKYVLPTNIRSRFARFGLQFGFIERETHKNTTWDFARFEVPGRWVDLSDATGGITMTSDMKGGYDVHGSTMMMSLLKSPMSVDKWADFGNRRHVIRLDFHTDNFSSRSQMIHDQLCNPKTFCQCYNQSLSNVYKQFISCDEKKLLLTALKVSEDGEGVIARFVEPCGGWVKTNVKFNYLSQGEWTFSLVSMKEVVQKVLPKVNGNNEVEIEAKPFQVISVLMKKSHQSPVIRTQTFSSQQKESSPSKFTISYIQFP